jgi:8-oxo-dGTP pyrophosphatase MutT (NUDIX family)
MTDRLRPAQVRSRLKTLSDSPKYELLSEGSNHGGPSFRPAAVLIPLTEMSGKMHVVLTKRSSNLREHSGEVSFPGGKMDPTDQDLLQTALREAQEEICLDPQVVTTHGVLLSMPTITGYAVTAWVGEYPQPYALSTNPSEIESLLLAPLDELADPAIHRIESRRFNGREFPIHFFEIRDFTVWGATGWMLHTLLDFLGFQSQPTQVL